MFTALLILACDPADSALTTSTATTSTATTSTATTGTTGSPCVPPAEGVVEVLAPDGVRLVADWYPASACGRPAITLLHMIPPSNTREDWPPELIDALRARDWGVLVVDRRGAGDSDGQASDAYEGDTAALDMHGCAAWLAAAGSGHPGIVGASNGTTTMLDHTLLAGAAGLAAPEALVFLSGGTYTEAQHEVGDLGALVPVPPALFAYPEAEAAWNEAQQALGVPGWEFAEYPGAAHGTRLFADAPSLAEDVAGFLDDHLP